MHSYPLLPENSQKWLKSNGCWGPYNFHNGKTNGYIHLLVLTEEEDIALRWAQMNRPVLDPSRIQKLEE